MGDKKIIDPVVILTHTKVFLPHESFGDHGFIDFWLRNLSGQEQRELKTFSSLVGFKVIFKAPGILFVPGGIFSDLPNELTIGGRGEGPFTLYGRGEGRESEQGQ